MAWTGTKYVATTAANVVAAPVRAAVNKARWGYVRGKAAYDKDVRKHYRERLLQRYKTTHDAIEKACLESRTFMKELEQDRWWHQRRVKW
jgi:hypothetical protein